jgi:hypothetical protein
MKLKTYYTTKEMFTRLESLLTEWKKIFAGYSSDNGRISRICRELKKLNLQRINSPKKKWLHELNR